MTVREILSKLSKVKQTANGWLALCPAHQDTKHSLSITENNGKILINCFAGCDIWSIASAGGFALSDLFKATSNGFNPIHSRRESRRIAAIYEYKDEHGDTIFENVRYEPKGFAQRRPDGTGGYIWNLRGVKPVPYRLPELLEATKADGAEIWLCEGEKDADAVRSLGFTATNFKKWQAGFNRYLKTAHAVLFQDHDAAGRTLATDAANVLCGNVASVKVIDLFEGEPLPEKHGKDVSDFIEQCRNDQCLTAEEIAERLSEIVERSDTWKSLNHETGSQNSRGGFTSLFLLKSANEWLMSAKTRPIPKMLFDEFWFEGELCILFADTGKGKSILAVQIGESIASGEPIDGFRLGSTAQKVLYFDFELSDKQFETRYSEKVLGADYFANHYPFSPNFFRAEINADAVFPAHFGTLEEYLNFSLEYHLQETGSRVLIVDNLTFLRTETTEKSRDALPLMKELKRLKNKFGLSILALAHTPKRDFSKPISVNDLQGSKTLSNFTDNLFAIGESHKDNRMRYLKQVKPRSAEIRFDANNVCVCQVAKPSNFLQFQFLSYGKESDHLKAITETDRDHLIERAKDLHDQGKSQRDIAEVLGVSPMTVNRYLKKNEG